jgi:hypothetical protein
MNISKAIVVYAMKADKPHPVSSEKSEMYGPRVAVLKDAVGRRLACVVESKKGFVVDLVKKMHMPDPIDEGWCLRDVKGRFVKRSH